MADHFVDYRGSLSGLDAVGSTLVFTTAHEEGQATGIFQYDVDKSKLVTTNVDFGVRSQLVADGQIYLGGTNEQLYVGKLGAAPKALGDAFDDPIVALAKRGDDVAVVSGSALHLVSGKGKRTSFDLGEPGRSVAVDPTGQWVVVGTTRGHVVVYSDADGDFAEVARNRLHDGEVTALAFAPDELRVYSTGSDCRLLVSFVRGAADTEDRGGNNMHEREARAILIGPDFVTAEGSNPRFFTAGMDSTIKSWPRGRGGSQRPAGHGDGVVQTNFLTIVDFDGKPHLAAAGLDATIRLFSFSAEGRIEERVLTIRDAYALAEQKLQEQKPKDRQAALDQLAAYADKRSLAQLAEHALSGEQDHKVMVHGVKLLGDATHRTAGGLLERFFAHGVSDARVAAFEGLRRVRGNDNLDVLRKALDSGHDDLGLHSIKAAAALGSDAAIELVRDSLDHGQVTVRFAALRALEALHGDTPQGTLLGLKASQADVRRMALSRVLERKLLGDASIEAQLRRMWTDSDDRVRLWSYVVSTHRKPNLVNALRAVDEDYHRQVFELEELPKDEKKRRKELPAAKGYDAKKLTEGDFRPLLEAMGSRSIDVSLRGARGLAALGDGRSFGTLLQLSREPQPGSRIAVCKSLAALGDPRGIKRVRAMLYDDDAQVRDAAFSALSALSESPLTTARAGLSVTALDVRERALALLVKTAKAQKSPDDDTNELLAMALNDSAQGLRQEAFKSVLNLAPKGQVPQTLRFIMKSVHADIRSEVLQESKKPKDADFRAIVLELIDDPDHGVRTEAFEYALDKWSESDQRSAYEAAIKSKHIPQRITAVNKLSEAKGEIRAMLVGALNDKETDVRLAAIRALVNAANTELLADALQSDHLDVRVEAASALAVVGDQRSLAPLVEVINGWHALLDSDPNNDDVEAYRPRLQSALTGLVHLGHPDSIDAVLTLMDGDASIANGAAATLPAIAHPSNLDKVRKMASHDNNTVKLLASLALAYNGDASCAQNVFGRTEPQYEIFAALGLRDASPERLLSYVDSEDARVRNIALAFVLALELTEHAAEGVPERCLSLLSARDALIRLRAAEALEHYSDQPKFYAWVYEMLNGFSSDWETEPRKLLVLSRALTLGEPRIAVRAGQVLAQLVESKADSFERMFQLFEERYADVLADLEKQANNPKSKKLSDRLARAWHRVKAKAQSIAVAPEDFAEALQALAFGSYVGLVRESQSAFNLRTAAIGGLVRLAPSNQRMQNDARSVVLLALGDPNQAVRECAFEALGELGTTPEVLSTEALSTGFPDMGRLGLELLASSADGGNELLERTLLESTNGLENQAAALLEERVGQVELYRIGLGAASQTFRLSCVRGLARESVKSEDALKALRGALDSGHDDVQHLAARELAKKKDSAAYDTLIAMVQSEDHSLQSQAVSSLQELGDDRTPGALLDRVEDDPDETANASLLLNGAVATSDPSIAPRLIAMIDADLHRSAAFEAAHQLTGYQQYAWVDDEEVTPKWEESLEPRHPQVFAELFDLAYRIADAGMLSSLVGQAKWPESNADIDRVLTSLLSYSDDNVRHRAVEIAGWRLRHRGGPADGLKDALQGRDPLDQFYAAEGLALAGHADGLAVLRTAVDAIDDWSLRERAVLALGVLADPSTVDMLLTIANDNGHGLRSPAIEAIGHMSKSDRANEVFDTLKRTVQNFSYDTIENALSGLRWFGTPGAWALLREQALNDNWWVANKAVELLRYDEDSRDVVAQVLRENDDWDVGNTAVDSLKHLYGPDSLEPDYLMMQACVDGLDEHEEAFKRLRENGEVGRILGLLPLVHEDNRAAIVPQLVAIVLSRDPLPVDEAAPMLDSEQAQTAGVAAQIVGGAGAEAGKKQAKALVAATEKFRGRWESTWSDFIANRRGARETLGELAPAYRRLVWACGQLQTAKPELLAAASLPDHEMTRPIREEALVTLGESWFGKDGVSALVKLASGGDARLRSMAAAELDRCAPAESAKLLSKSTHDDVSFGRLLNSLEPKDATKPLRDAVAEAGGIALPRLAAIGDVEGLLAAMRNANLGDSTRRGAIDALGTFANTDVASSLAEFGADEDQDEQLRKAAWRARRRVQRAVTAQEGR